MSRPLVFVITAIEPAVKGSFFYSFMYTRLIGQYNGNRPISFVYVSEPPIAVITALVVHFQSLLDCESVWHTPSRTMKVKDDREELSDVTNLLWG